MKRLLLSLIICLATLAGASAQDYVPTPVQVSTEKVNISGRVYWTHKVLEKQTLYSIAKAYSVSVDDICEANPSLRDGLKSGSLIFIPCDKVIRQDQNQEKPLNQENQQSQTLQQHDDAVVISGHDAGQQKGTEDAIEVPYGYTLHIVRWFESLRSIASRYGVSEEAIMEVNGLTDKRVYRRQKLLIPPTEYIPKAFRTGNEDDSLKESVADTIGEIATGNAPGQNLMDRLHHGSLYHRFTKFNPAKVAVILPLNSESAEPSQNFYDFYCGMLLALEGLKESGVNAEITFWDSGKAKIRSLEADGKLKGADLIIGPVMERDLSQLASYCDSLHIPFVSPLDQKAASLIPYSSYMYQVPPSDATRINNSVESLNASHSDQVTLIYEKGCRDTALVRMYREAFSSQGIKYQSYSYDIHQGRSVRDKLQSLMNRSYKQKVVVASEDEAFVLDCLRNLNLLIDFGHYDLQAWGQPKWRNFETLDPGYCHKANLHLSMPYYVDYSSKKVQSFVMHYRDLYNAEPTPFSFQGYDIAFYFISATNETGGNIESYVEFTPKSMLQSEMKFRRSGRHGGFINIATKDVVLKPDYSIE